MTGRIIVALDESAASLVALESAARLAAAFSAEIFGLFVEDIDMIAIAGLPGGATVSLQDASTMPLNEALLFRSLRVRARRLREQVARIAETYRVPWHFEIVRGHTSEEILRMAGTCEMIAIGSSAHRGPGVYGSTARMIMEKAHCSVLVVRRDLPQGRSILVLSERSQRAREIGASLARKTGARLIVQAPPVSARAALDLLSRLAPSYLVIDRSALALFGVSAHELAERLKLEGLIVGGEAEVG